MEEVRWTERKLKEEEFDMIVYENKLIEETGNRMRR
jgi:hypothetical protein